MRNSNYKIASPMTYEDLRHKIPRYEAIPIWLDNECYLVYWNVFNSIYYMSADSQGELSNKKSILFYDRRLQPERVLEKREYVKWFSFQNEIRTIYNCPNCDIDLIPYDYDFKRIFTSGQVRQKFCRECGYPLLWY